MIYNVIKTLTRSGIKDIVIVLGGESVGDFVRLLGDGSEFNANFSYVYQQRSGGIVEALSLTKHIVRGHKVAVILGDNIFEDTFKSEIEDFDETNSYNCYLFLKEVSDPERFGVAELHPNGNIKNIKEIPKEPKSSYAVTDFYLYDEKIFDVIKKIVKEIGYSDRDELEITDVNNYYSKNGKVQSKIMTGFWSDAGTFKTLFKSTHIRLSNTSYGFGSVRFN